MGFDPGGALGVGESIAAFANGDWVMVATFYDSRPDQADNAIVRIDGATGGVVWLCEAGRGGCRRLATSRDRFRRQRRAVQFLQRGRVKIDGATGEVLWQNDIGEYAQRGAFALDAHDDVLVGGAVSAGPGSITHDLVVKLTGASGATLWRVEGRAST